MKNKSKNSLFKKIIIIVILAVVVVGRNAHSSSDTYIIPKDVIEARDAAIKSSEAFKEYIVKRYLTLLKKTNMSLEELNEFQALESIIYDKKYTPVYFNNKK